MREIEIKMDITLVLTELAVKKNRVILYVELNENIRVRKHSPIQKILTSIGHQKLGICYDFSNTSKTTCLGLYNVKLMCNIT